MKGGEHEDGDSTAEARSARHPVAPPQAAYLSVEVSKRGLRTGRPPRRRAGKFFGRAYLVKHFDPTALDGPGMCEPCRQALET